MQDVTMGLEEEYQLLDSVTGDLRQDNVAVLERARPAMGDSVHPELMRSQVEISTGVCTTLDDLDSELRELRRKLNASAAQRSLRIGAAGSHPTATWQTQQVTPRERYEDLVADFQQVARETLIFGCHVHIGVADPDDRIEAMNRVRPYLPVLLALSANSPFWAGHDTGYASYRTAIFRRWPMTGMPLVFRDHGEYRELIDGLVSAGMLEDATKIYWDVRPSDRFPTLEVRIADVCLSVREAITVAGLAAAAVVTVMDEIRRGEPRIDVRHELLDAAVWKASRHGLDEGLLDFRSGHSRPAAEVVTSLLESVRPALAALGTEERVAAGVAQILEQGNGASRQRRAYRSGGFPAVLDLIGEETAATLA